MTLSLNQRAHELADLLAADADALRVAARTLAGGTRVIDCGSAVPGGLEAGRRFAEITMGGLGSVSFAPLVLEGRWMPGAHGRHRPSRARLPRLPVRGLEDRPRRLLRHGQRAGPRADPRRGALRRPRRRRAREHRGPHPRDRRRAAGRARGVRGRARRRGAGRPHAAVRADGEPRRRGPGRRARRRDRPAQAARARVRRPARGERLRDLSAAAGGEAPIRRRSGARTTRSSTAARSSSPSTRPTTSSRGSSIACPPPRRRTIGEPFGKVLEAADWDFYAIDPLLFSPAEVRLVSVESGRSFHAGGVRLDVLEQSFRG